MHTLNYNPETGDPFLRRMQLVSGSASRMAQRVIGDCLQVKEDEQVLISSWDNTLEYASALALETERIGATPLVTIGTDEMFWGHLTETPETFYSKRPDALLAALDHVNAAVWLLGPRDPAGFRRIPGERLARSFAMSETYLMDKMRERKIRSVSLSFGQVTPERAKVYGFNFSRWQRVTSGPVNVDHQKMSVLGKKLRSVLEGAERVQTNSKNGTSLAMMIGSRPVHINDGMIDEDDVIRGTINETLPSGSVNVAPVESSVEGTVIFDQPRAIRGKIVRELSLKFESGKITEIGAKANFGSFSDYYKGASGDKDQIGVFTIGVNPKAGFIGYATDSLVLGAITISIGANREFGGNNDTSFAYAQTLARPTLTVDGKLILEQGRFRI